MAHARIREQIKYRLPTTRARGACGGSVVDLWSHGDADDNIIFTMCRNRYRNI